MLFIPFTESTVWGKYAQYGTYSCHFSGRASRHSCMLPAPCRAALWLRAAFHMFKAPGVRGTQLLVRGTATGSRTTPGVFNTTTLPDWSRVLRSVSQRGTWVFGGENPRSKVLGASVRSKSESRAARGPRDLQKVIFVTRACNSLNAFLPCGVRCLSRHAGRRGPNTSR